MWSGADETLEGKKSFRNRVNSENIRRINLPKIRFCRSKNSTALTHDARLEQNQSAEPRKKLQKISLPEKLQKSDSDEELQLQSQKADSIFPEEKFQQS